MKNIPLPRLELDPAVRAQLLPFCRLARGDVWIDAQCGHRVGCIDVTAPAELEQLMQGQRGTLAIHDPPYNVAAFAITDSDAYIAWCQQWITATNAHLAPDASLYIWLGADQNNGFQPLPEFMLMMRRFPFKSRSLITMRNQRGYGTQHNWMAVRQELLYYTKGTPVFNVAAEYTAIPKILRGYYKQVGGRTTENSERSHATTIRAGNVWVDVQQVFYRMQENVNGCYAQKPLPAIDRIIRASSQPDDLVFDWFAHSGTTLLSSEINHRRCVTSDIDPIFCEITIRRLEHFRATGQLGWQNSNPFERELGTTGAPAHLPMNVNHGTCQGDLLD